MSGWNVYVIDALALLGTAAISLAIGWVLCASSPLMKIHAASKAVVTGALLIVVASCLTGRWDVALRALLVGVFLLVTSPISAHALARLALKAEKSPRHAHVEPRPARDPLPRASRDSRRP